MKKLIIVFLFLLLLPLNINALSSNYKDVLKDIINISSSDDKINIYLFYGDGCGYCKKENLFLDEIESKYGDNVKIYRYETWDNDENFELMKKAKEFMNDDINGAVPYTVIGEKTYVGFSETYGERIEKQIIEYLDMQHLPESLKPVILGFIYSAV